MRLGSYCIALTQRLAYSLQGYVDPRDLRSFPTRRSSDLSRAAARAGAPHPEGPRGVPKVAIAAGGTAGCYRDLGHSRSEEHTSELQSHSDLVCRLLLEKKKRRPQRTARPTQTLADRRIGA